MLTGKRVPPSCSQVCVDVYMSINFLLAVAVALALALTLALTLAQVSRSLALSLALARSLSLVSLALFPPLPKLLLTCVCVCTHIHRMVKILFNCLFKSTCCVYVLAYALTRKFFFSKGAHRQSSARRCCRQVFFSPKGSIKRLFTY